MDEATKTDDIAAAWVAREDKSPLDPAALRQRDDWLAADPRHRGAYVRAQAVFLRAGRASALGRGFGQVPADHGGGRPARRRGPRWVAALAAAAVLAVLAVGLQPMLMQTGAAEYRTGLGQVLRVPLQDGSVMTLNSDSQVRVLYGGNERRVTLLRGETLVDVTPDVDRPFVVRTDETDVVAVGTSFSVRKGDGKSFVVVVNEGIVDIRQPHPGVEPLRVHANHEVVASSDRGLSVNPLIGKTVHRRLAWREGLIFFEGDTLADAALEFSRYSDVRLLIEDPEIAQRRVVGVYSSADPEGFAKAVADSLGLEVETAPGGVYLRAPH